ncbi:hypothetical protein Csa_016890 [Cucumis sativus]|nr:hypothetical protein Csa_016890 [Cucumis sativus]
MDSPLDLSYRGVSLVLSLNLILLRGLGGVSSPFVPGGRIPYAFSLIAWGLKKQKLKKQELLNLPLKEKELLISPSCESHNQIFIRYNKYIKLCEWRKLIREDRLNEQVNAYYAEKL